MKKVNAFIGRTQSARESANIALNAAQEAYFYLEAERKGTLGVLLKKAVENREKSGVDAQKALNDIAACGQYLKDLSRGDKMFYQATADIRRESSCLAGPYKPA